MNMNGCMKQVLAVVLVAASGVGLADEWYVDPVNGLDGRDGSCSNVVSETVGPRKTLEKAMELVQAGDTLWLLPGEYKEGSMRDGRCRLWVKKPNVRIRSTAGADRTFIVGHGTAITDKDAMNCVQVYEWASGVVLDGITFKDGVGRRDETVSPAIKDNGGGLADSSGSAWAIGCVFTNCTAYIGGGQYFGSAARCKYVDCRSSGGGWATAYVDWIEYSLFLHGAADDGTRTCYGFTTAGNTFVNCTFYGARTSVFAGKNAPFRVCNCISVGNTRYGTVDNGRMSDTLLYVTNSLIGVCQYDPNATDNSEVGIAEKGAGLVAPAAGDYRVVTTSPAVGRADRSVFANVSLPSGYERRDFAGNPVPDEGPLTAGCLQEPAVQTGARFDFKKAMEVEGLDHVFAANEYLHPTGEPWAYRMRPVAAEGQVTYSIQAAEEKESNAWFYHYPVQGETEGWIPFPASLPAGTNLTVDVSFATAQRYVDAEHGDDSWDGTSATHVDGTSVGPWQTLAHACTNVSDLTIVNAAPGVYSNGVVTTSETTSKGLVCIQKRRAAPTALIGLRATEGPSKTFIVGEPDPETGGRGPDAVGGLLMKSGQAFVQGFTFTGCYTVNKRDNYIEAGAAVSSGSGTLQILDCVITSNSAYQASAVDYGFVIRCRIEDNEAYNYTVSAAKLIGCLCAGNRQTRNTTGTLVGAFASGGWLQGCTLDLGGRCRPNNDASLHGCIVRDPHPDAVVDPSWVGMVFGGDPVVADAAAHDFRLGILSPAIARADWWEMPLAYRFGMTVDVDGRPLVVSADGRITAGAVQNDPPLPCVVLEPGPSGETVVDGAFGTNVVTEGRQVKLTASMSRPFVGFSVDGVVQPYAGRTYAADPSARGVSTVKAVYGTDWYVDAENGDDTDNDGGAPDRAKKTIRAATEFAVSNDVVHVAAGIYGEAEGTQKPQNDMSVFTRVVIPPGVTVVGTEGAERTFIVGAPATGPDDVAYGTGTGAVRCVWAKAGAVLKGMTLTGGHTWGAPTSTLSLDRNGSAFYSEDVLGATLEDCIVSNNVAWTATIRGAVVNRCRVVGNLATSVTTKGEEASGGPAGYLCAWYNSIIADNVANATVYAPKAFENCTMGFGNIVRTGARGSAQAIYLSADGTCPLVNCLMLDGRYYGTQHCTNCVLRSEQLSTKYNLLESNCVNCVFLDSSIEAAQQTDADYRPLRATFKGLDRGDRTLSSALVGDVDADGGPRVMNGQIDPGAIEYDWRGDYAALLGRRVTVTAASASVTNVANGVCLPDGAEIAGRIDDGDGRLVTFEVSGGTLSFYSGGTLVGTFTADGSAPFKPAADGTFRFVFAAEEPGVGFAVLRRFRSTKGTVLIVR